MHIMKRTYLTEAQHHCMQTWLSSIPYSCEVLSLCSFKSFQKAGGRQQYCLSKTLQLTFSKLIFQLDSLVQHFIVPYPLKLQLLRTNAVPLTSTKYLSLDVGSKSPVPNLQLPLEFSHGFNTFTLLLFFVLPFYRSHPYRTFLKQRRCSETQFSKKHLLQQRLSFMEDILACFGTAGDTQEVCKRRTDKAHRQGSKLIYTKKKKTDTTLLSLCSLVYEVFI